MKSCKIENCTVQSVICDTRENWHVNFINKVSSEINLYLLIWLFMESLPEWTKTEWKILKSLSLSNTKHFYFEHLNFYSSTKCSCKFSYQTCSFTIYTTLCLAFNLNNSFKISIIQGCPSFCLISFKCPSPTRFSSQLC